MQVFAYKATERGIRERNVHLFADERATRLAAQRTACEAEQATRQAQHEHIERIRADASQRAKAYASELKQAGFRYRPSLADIERKACRAFKVTVSELHSARRFKHISFAKQFVMYWAVRLTPYSLPQIARLMGGIDHTTVLHGKRVYPEKRAKMGRFLRPAS